VTFTRENSYDPETYEISVPIDASEPEGAAVKIGVFDKVTVEITVEKVRVVVFFFFYFLLILRIVVDW
jgi:hypothetical protein